MEQDHLPITLPVLEEMRLAPRTTSWTWAAVRDVVAAAGEAGARGRVVGMDISDEMIRHARRASADLTI